MKMTFDEYDKEIESLERLPDPKLSGDYGITRTDISEMEEAGDKYIPFLMYLSTRPYYRLYNQIDKSFENVDALSCKDASKEINDLLCRLLELQDGV